MLSRRRVEGFIPYIYDYCDQRCSRCSLSSRCLSYVVLDRLGKQQKDEVDEAYALMEEGMIREIARERGLATDALEGKDPLEGLRGELERAEGHRDETALAAVKDEDAYACYCIYERLIDHEQVGIYNLVDALENEEGGLRRVRKLEAQLDVVNWNMGVMLSKLKRAYYAGSLYRLFTKVLGRAGADANGSAKVALLAMEASAKAWEAFAEELPEAGKVCRWMTSTLDQLRLEVTKSFPNAPRFKRPGFDDRPEYRRPRPATGRW